jgi:opacity protein-like surface antigen
MNTCRPALIIGLIASGLACSASADQVTDTGAYLSAGVGQNWIQSGIPEENTTVLRLAAGWQFNPYLGVELSYNDFGTFPGPTTAFTDFDMTGTSLSVIGQLPLSSTVALYGKAGQTWWRADSSFFFFSRNGGMNESGTLNFSESDPHLGVGISVEVTRNIELDLEYNFYQFEFSGYPMFDNDNSALVLAVKYEL